MRAFAIAASLICLAGPGFAEEQGKSDPLAGENGRYSMTPTAEGFLRLDTRTGAVSLCKIENGAARCQAAVEERAALQDEIDRLARQNESLKSRPLISKLPSRQDLDRAMDYAEHFMRRMMKLLQEDNSGKDRT
jgi:hypothetical protein